MLTVFRIFAFAAVILGASGTVVAQEAASQSTSTRRAFVVGIDEYQNVLSLDRAVNDARAISSTLSELGFSVELVENPDRRTLTRRFLEFRSEVASRDVVLFFFAGHGVTIGGGNYLLPSDVPDLGFMNADLVASEGLGVHEIMGWIQARDPRISILIIDACRDAPFSRAGTRGAWDVRGLNRIEAANGTFILYSAGFGQAAVDGLGDKDDHPNSVFTRVLTSKLTEPRLELRRLAQEVRREVYTLTRTEMGYDQRPAYQDELLGDFYFAPDGDALNSHSSTKEEQSEQRGATIPIPTPRPKEDSEQSAETVVWSRVEKAGADGQPFNTEIHGEATFPAEGVKLKLIVRRNENALLPASHIVEVMLLGRDGRVAREFKDLQRIAVKASEHHTGIPLKGVPAKIADGYFLVALGNLEAEAAKSALLRDWEWIDVSVSRKSGQNSVFALRKDEHGQAVFERAFQEWQERRKQLNEAEPVVWSLVEKAGADGQPSDPEIHGDASFPAEGVKLKLVVRRNKNSLLSASYIVEVMLLTNEGQVASDFEDLQRIALKESEYGIGAPLKGVEGKIGDGYFFLALGDLKDEEASNLALLRNTKWIDIWVSRKSGQDAVFALRKGEHGQVVFDSVFQNWREELNEVWSLPLATGPTGKAAEDGIDSIEGIKSLPDAKLPQTTVEQEAIFYEERTRSSEGTAQEGSVVWSLIEEPPADDLPPEPVIEGEAAIPGKNIRLKLTIRRNTDDSLPASHIIELIMLTPEDFEGGGIDNMLRIAMKRSEQDTGNPLLGIPAKIDDGFFVFALSDTKADTGTNLTLLRRLRWIDVSVVYDSGRRALIAMAKGEAGGALFEAALDKWARLERSAQNEGAKDRLSVYRLLKEAGANPSVRKNDDAYGVQSDEFESRLLPEATAPWSVQIASKPTIEGAKKAYSDIAREYSSVLSGLEVKIVKAEIEGRGVYYRVRVPAKSREEAIDVCERLQTAGGSCLVSR